VDFKSEFFRRNLLGGANGQSVKLAYWMQEIRFPKGEANFSIRDNVCLRLIYVLWHIGTTEDVNLEVLQLIVELRLQAERADSASLHCSFEVVEG
jgi:hypothetical protein